MNFKYHVLKSTFPFFMEGLKVTIQYSIIAIILCILWGIIIGTITYQRVRIISPMCRWYISFFRETPLLVQMYIIFYGLPQFKILLPASVCGVIALMLNDGAFIAEIIRGGLQSIEKGQSEAAISLGFNKFQTWRYFLFPQAWSKVIESIMGIVSIIIKDTSLLTLITITELTFVAQKVNAQRFEPTTAFLTSGALYFLLFLVVQGIKKLIILRRTNGYSRS